MSTDPRNFIPGADAFGAFWQDFTSRIMSAGLPTPVQNPNVEMLNQTRRAFFDALAKHSEEFMRSEAFLHSMKQAMDASLAWQQTLNQTLQKGLSAAQMPTRNDTDSIAMLIRGVEDRLLDRIGVLEERIDELSGGSGPDKKSAKPRTTASRPRKTGRSGR